MVKPAIRPEQGEVLATFVINVASFATGPCANGRERARMDVDGCEMSDTHRTKFIV
jgi:hypothetical protein